MSVLMESSSPLPSRVTRAIALNAALWTAGNVLTTGGFLSYFATDLGARGFNLALLLAVPELVGLTGLASRGLVQWVGDRRKVWLITTLIARAITFLLPCVGLTRQWFSPEAAPWMLVAILVITQAAQGVATTLYFSWLADLVPRQEWGRLFARRNLAALTVQLVLPLLAAWFRDEAKRRLDAEWLWWAYAAVFTTGALLLLASVWPMWTVPHPSGSNARPVFEAGALRVLLQNREIRWLLAHSWCLAVANGVTQAVFFQYQVRIVKLSLTGYYALVTLMVLWQMVTSAWAGRCRTAAEHRRVLFQSTLVTSLALGCWCLASAEQWWWLCGAFFCWGFFGAVNVAGPNLMLCYAPPGDNVHHLALFRQVAGALAGVSGILGGLWFDALTGPLTPKSPPPSMSIFLLIFGVSWFGRALAAFLVLAVRPPQNEA